LTEAGRSLHFTSLDAFFPVAKEADMSGFRKFRSTLHRRRRSLEAVELGYLATQDISEQGAARSLPVTQVVVSAVPDPDTRPLDFSPSVEAREIGPSPIAWLKSRRPETDN